jgi:two-component sensor histidine kinase
LQALVRTIVSPFESFAGERVSVTGPEIPVSGNAITPLALVFHELATNAAKYGALSNTEGAIEVALDVSGPELYLTWSERGGPPLDPSLRTEGFGTKLIDGTATGQLQGTVAREWHRDGLVITMTLPSALLNASGTAA